MKKLKLVSLVILSSINIYAQETTYSLYEERMGQYINLQLAYGWKYDSSEIIKVALDSCKRFLNKYPRSFMKPGVLSYMLRMTSEITSDPKQILPLVDSILVYDNLSTTQFGIAELLIEKNIDPVIGRKLLVTSFPQLTVPYHRFKANILFARLEMADRQFGFAKQYFEQALKEDSTRAEGWQEYADYLKYSEQPGEYKRVMTKMQSMERLSLLKYEDNAKNSSNINKTFLHYKLQDIDGKSVNLQEYLGAPIIVQNFNFWCPMEKKQINTLGKIIKKFPTVKILLMNVGETPKELKTRYLNKPAYKFFTKHKIVFGDSILWHQIVGHTAKSLLVIDKMGNVRADYHGDSKLLEPMLENDLQKLTK